MTYKPRCDDEARSNEQIDNFSQAIVSPSGMEKSKSGAAANNAKNCADGWKLREKSKDGESCDASVLLVRYDNGRIGPSLRMAYRAVCAPICQKLLEQVKGFPKIRKVWWAAGDSNSGPAD